MHPVTRLWISISVVLAVLVLGTMAYVMVEGQPVLDSLFMTVITLTTVGYEEVFELDDSGKLLTIAIILGGYAALSVALANLVSLIVGGELRAIRGRLRMKTEIQNLKDHVIICGFGRMGTQVALQLRTEGVPCVTIDTGEAQAADDQGVLYVQGDATEDHVLEEAGLPHAKALVASLASDADNVYVTLTARELRPDIRIIARAEMPAAESKLRRAGADHVISPQMIGANKTANLLCRPHVVELVDMAAKGVDLEIAQYEVDEDSQLVGTALRDSGIRDKSGTIVVAIKRADGAQVFSPGPDEQIRKGDRLILLGRGGLSARLETTQL